MLGVCAPATEQTAGEVPGESRSNANEKVGEPLPWGAWGRPASPRVPGEQVDCRALAALPPGELHALALPPSIMNMCRATRSYLFEVSFRASAPQSHATDQIQIQGSGSAALTSAALTASFSVVF